MEVITREEAKAAGLKRFYTGVPCDHGHTSERYVSSNGCLECVRPRSNAEKTREWKKKNPELRAAQRKRYKKKYPEKGSSTKTAQKIRRRVATKGALMPDRTKDDAARERDVILRAQILTSALGREYHCDHIVALSGILPSGEPIRGPHVWWNLRPLDGEENVRKSNVVTEEHIQFALSKLRGSGVSEPYVAAVEWNLRSGEQPCNWILPVKGMGTQGT